MVVFIVVLFFGIMLGFFLGLLCWEEGMVSCFLLLVFFGFGKFVIILGFVYLLVLVLMIDRSFVLKYFFESFIFGYRVICVLLVVMLVC